MRRKGRARLGYARLTADDARAIRERHAEGIAHDTLAAEFAIGTRHVARIVSGERWA